jgi:hypothetical protein
MDGHKAFIHEPILIANSAAVLLPLKRRFNHPPISRHCKQDSMAAGKHHLAQTSEGASEHKGLVPEHMRKPIVPKKHCAVYRAESKFINREAIYSF